MITDRQIATAIVFGVGSFLLARDFPLLWLAVCFGGLLLFVGGLIWALVCDWIEDRRIRRLALEQPAYQFPLDGWSFNAATGKWERGQ